MPTSYSNKYESQETSYEDKYVRVGITWDEMIRTWNEVEETWDSLSGINYVDKYTPR